MTRYVVTLTNHMFGTGKYVETVTTPGPDPFAAVTTAITRWRKRDKNKDEATHTWQADDVSIHVERVR